MAEGLWLVCEDRARVNILQLWIQPGSDPEQIKRVMNGTPKSGSGIYISKDVYNYHRAHSRQDASKCTVYRQIEVVLYQKSLEDFESWDSGPAQAIDSTATIMLSRMKQLKHFVQTLEHST